MMPADIESENDCSMPFVSDNSSTSNAKNVVTPTPSKSRNVDQLPPPPPHATSAHPEALLSPTMKINSESPERIISPIGPNCVIDGGNSAGKCAQSLETPISVGSGGIVGGKSRLLDNRSQVSGQRGSKAGDCTPLRAVTSTVQESGRSKLATRIHDPNEWDCVWDKPPAARLASTETLSEECSPDNVSPRSVNRHPSCQIVSIGTSNNDKSIKRITDRPNAVTISASSSCIIPTNVVQDIPLRQSNSQASNIMPINKLSVIGKNSTCSNNSVQVSYKDEDNLTNASCHTTDDILKDFSMPLEDLRDKSKSGINGSESLKEENPTMSESTKDYSVLIGDSDDDSIDEVSSISPSCAPAPAQSSALTTSSPITQEGTDAGVVPESTKQVHPSEIDFSPARDNNASRSTANANTKELSSKEQYCQTSKQPSLQKECQTETAQCQKECQTDATMIPYSPPQAPPSKESSSANFEVNEKFKPQRPCQRAASERIGTNFQRSCSTDYGSKRYSDKDPRHLRQQSSDYLFFNKRKDDVLQQSHNNHRPAHFKFFRPLTTTQSVGLCDHKKLDFQFSDPGLCDYEGLEYCQKKPRYSAVEVVTAEVLVVGSTSMQDAPMVVPSSPPDETPPPRKKCSFVS